MTIPTSISDLNATASSNSPAGTDAIGTTLDDFIRAHAAIIRQVSDAKADLTSAVLVTPNLGTPSAGILTNCTGTASGLTAGNLSGGTVNATTITGAGAATMTGNGNQYQTVGQFVLTDTNSASSRRFAFIDGWGTATTVGKLNLNIGVGSNNADPASAGATLMSFTASLISTAIPLNVVGGIQRNGTLLVSDTAPTIASGFGTSASISLTNGSLLATISVGTGGTASTGIVALPTATNGWRALIGDGQNAIQLLGAKTVVSGSSATQINFACINFSTGAAFSWPANYSFTALFVPY